MPQNAHRRTGVRRTVRHDYLAATAAAAVGPIEHGMEVYGLSVGEFSLTDLLLHVLEAAGPADVVVSTWTAAGADIEEAFRLVSDGRIRSIRFIVDFSFPSRQPAYCAALRERFGDEAIRVTKNHAKFVLVRNAQWSVVVRTSMNLNRNRRLESYEVSDDPEMADFLEGVVARVFDAATGSESLDARPGEAMAQFDAMAAAAGSSFDPSPLGRDIGRAGLSPWRRPAD